MNNNQKEQFVESLQDFINEHYNKLNKKQIKQLSILIERVKKTNKENITIADLMKAVFMFWKE